MAPYTREQFLERLENDWAALVGRFRRLPAGEQAAFLEKQGYPSLAALLGHVVAWWQDGVQVIERFLLDPTLPLPEYDVDDFNARAIARFAATGEAEMVELYEEQRQKMVELVKRLSDEELLSKRVNTRLYYEILMHWQEHELN